MSGSLTNPQRKHLRRLAHAAPAALQLGKHGMTPNFLASFEHTLSHHELLKLRFSNLKEERKELSAAIEAATGSVLVSLVGHTAVFYRESPDPDKRKIVLPRAARPLSLTIS
jgi:RNA-binding protein